MIMQSDMEWVGKAKMMTQAVAWQQEWKQYAMHRKKAMTTRALQDNVRTITPDNNYLNDNYVGEGFTDLERNIHEFYNILRISRR